MTKEILIRNKELGDLYALVDDEDYPLLNRHPWFARIVNGEIWYVSTQIPTRTKKVHAMYMHHFIMGMGHIDHINRNTLDNRKENLRVATHQQNGWNKGKNKSHHGKPTTSQYKGVSYRPLRGKDRWVAIIKHVEPGAHKSTGKLIRIGYFDTEVEAARAYNAKVKELCGEWAWVNPILGEAA